MNDPFIGLPAITFLKLNISFKVLNAASITDFCKNFNPLSAKPTKWSNILKQFVGNLPTNCLSAFDYFVGLALKGLREQFYCQHMSTRPN